MPNPALLADDSFRADCFAAARPDEPDVRVCVCGEKCLAEDMTEIEDGTLVCDWCADYIKKMEGGKI